MSHRGDEPSDFDGFWRGRAAAAHGHDLSVTRRPTSDPGTYAISFTSVGGVRIGGWLQLPEGPPTCAMIVGHGYAGRDAPDPSWAPPGAAVLYPVARGLPELSLKPDIPSDSQDHVLHGIEHRDTYVIGACAADLLWCAAGALEILLGQRVGQRFGGLRTTYQASSFGGGVGALAAPWEERLDALVLHLPTFGDHPRRLAVPCTGSGAALSRWVLDHPEAWDVLPYFDAAHAAARLRVPTIVAPAHEDPAVPPVGQWAVAEAVGERWQRVMPMTTGHLEDDPEEIARLQFAARELAEGGGA